VVTAGPPPSGLLEELLGSGDEVSVAELLESVGLADVLVDELPVLTLLLGDDGDTAMLLGLEVMEAPIIPMLGVGVGVADGCGVVLARGGAATPGTELVDD
jgi:hypothetical protein